MIQVRIGTIEYKSCPSGLPDSGFVTFDGLYEVDTDGFTSLMIWDNQLQNIRSFTPNERMQFDNNKKNKKNKDSLISKILEATANSLISGIPSNDPLWIDIITKLQPDIDASKPKP